MKNEILPKKNGTIGEDMENGTKWNTPKKNTNIRYPYHMAPQGLHQKTHNENSSGGGGGVDEVCGGVFSL